jgi:hypothetical protein
MTNIGSTIKGKKKLLNWEYKGRKGKFYYNLDTWPQYFEQIPLDENQPFPLNLIS